MGSLFYGLNTAVNTLRAQTDVLNITGHNIANANTPGYSRQQVGLSQVSDQAQAGLRMGVTLPIGNGVEVKQVSRIRNALYDEIYRKENQNLNFNITTQDLLHQVELLFDEPTDRSLGGIINDFFNGWLDIANQPQNSAARQSLHSVGEEMTDRFHRIYNALVVMREDIDEQISAIPEQINIISAEIADLNVAIRKSEVQGGTANDLRDKLDYLVDELTQYADVRAVGQADGTTTILVGNKVVVDHDTASTLSAKTTLIGEEGLKRTVIVAEDGTEYEPTRGKLGALMTMRDETLLNLMGELNTLAGAIVDTINFDHRIGYGLDGANGRNFFDPGRVYAYNIELSSDIDDVSNIAVSIDGLPGDNQNALNINDLKNRRVIDGSFSINEYYNSIISHLGVIGREAESNRINQELLVNQIDNSRESVKGVSIDEEMVLMLQSQRIYQSASRLIVTLDELLQEVINLK